MLWPVTACSTQPPERFPAPAAAAGVSGAVLPSAGFAVLAVGHRANTGGSLAPVNTFLALGQMLVSIALMAAILLQARGAGLSATFGGDSSVYRSRRGIERRLWQFTIALAVLFVLFSLTSFVFPPR